MQLTGLANLRYLDVHDTPTTRKSLKSIQRLLPECLIVVSPNQFSELGRLDINALMASRKVQVSTGENSSQPAPEPLAGTKSRKSQVDPSGLFDGKAGPVSTTSGLDQITFEFTSPKSVRGIGVAVWYYGCKVHLEYADSVGDLPPVNGGNPIVIPRVTGIHTSPYLWRLDLTSPISARVFRLTVLPREGLQVVGICEVELLEDE